MTRKSAVTLVELLFVVAIFSLVISLLTPFVHMAKERGRRIRCEQNLREINLGLKRFAADHDEAFPKELKELYPNYVTEQSAFDCPASKSVGMPDNPDYKYNAGLKALSPDKSVVVEDPGSSHDGRVRHVLRVDGSIDWIK
jgi:type II secretory pathway pseudopilin PulG